jgi:hypothetical protein
VASAIAFACSWTVLSACGDDDDNGDANGGAGGSGASSAASGTGGSAGSGGSNASSGGASSAGGTKSTGGTAGSSSSGAGGSSGDGANGGDSANGGAGGTGATEGCIDGLEGTWKITGYEAYLRVDDDCQVTLFCDLVKDYHSTGYFEGNTITLIDVATSEVTLEGDTLTLLIPSETTDTIVFVRQESEDVVPEACLE